VSSNEPFSLIGKHYVMTIVVERIEHARKEDYQGNNRVKVDERRKATVLNLALSARELEKLLQKGAAHLALVEDDGSVMAVPIKEPGTR
jgi:hypothetical protein